VADIGKLKPILPKFATVKANIRVQEDALKKEQKKQERMEKKKEEEKKTVFKDVTKNPYLESMEAVEGLKVRRVKRLNFVTPGKYVAMAEQLREEAFVEKLKQDIAEAAKKAGLEKDLDLVSDAGIRVSLFFDSLDRHNLHLLWNGGMFNYYPMEITPI
jgi:U4/U6 small nuclear ribonucleoprotein PRP3